MKQEDLERVSNFPQVPLLADGGGWLPVSSFHFLMSHHTRVWALGLCVCNRDHIGSCDDSELAEVIAITSREKYFDCMTVVNLESWFYQFVLLYL